jgi:hypothetical protein
MYLRKERERRSKRESERDVSKGKKKKGKQTDRAVSLYSQSPRPFCRASKLPRHEKINKKDNPMKRV